MTLSCEGRFYNVHRLVLSICSDYFDAVLEHTPCKHPYIILKDVKAEDLEALLSFMYLGEVSITHNDLERLIKTAEQLCIKGLAVPDEPPSGYAEAANLVPTVVSRGAEKQQHQQPGLIYATSGEVMTFVAHTAQPQGTQQQQQSVADVTGSFRTVGTTRSLQPASKRRRRDDASSGMSGGTGSLDATTVTVEESSGLVYQESSPPARGVTGTIVGVAVTMEEPPSPNSPDYSRRSNDQHQLKQEHIIQVGIHR